MVKHDSLKQEMREASTLKAQYVSNSTIQFDDKPDKISCAKN